MFGARRGSDVDWKRLFGSIAVLLVVQACVLVAGRSAALADAQGFSVQIARVDADPKIDGTIDDPLWQKATHVELGWDYQFRRPAAEKTDAYIMADGSSIYVAMVAQQSEPVTATLHTND